MTKEEIIKILPHRDNMLLLDEVYKIDDYAYGTYEIRKTDWFLQGHFPENPVVPGVILCEILAQSVCILLADVMDNNKIPVYTTLNNVKFKSPVRPGDLFQTKCCIKRSKPPFYFAEGEGYVGDQLCLKAEFSFALTEKPVCSQKF